jgi:pimeloyl-ACP methyl ester carboxylesterase
VALSLVLVGCDNGGSGPETIEREPTPIDPVETTTGDERNDDDRSTDDEGDRTPPPDPSDTTDVDEPADVGALNWTLCDDEFDAALRCATLPVPLDHDQPDGEMIELALIRLAASGSRQGAVLVNPGGPGGSGVDYVGALATYAVGEMGLQDFDLVGFDPRGVDRSNGLRCLDDSEFDELLFDRVDDPGDPDAGDPGDVADGSIVTGAHDERLVEACVAEFGDTLQHFSTEATARDMDLIRDALGDDTISYIGISYGTYLGAMYATLFPDRVRAFVLDSAFEPTGDTIEQQYLTQLVGFEEAFTAWADDCQTDPSCNFGGDAVARSWDALRVQLDENPLANADGRSGDASVMEIATIAALYDPLTWPVLASALDDAYAGDPAGLFGLADLYVGRSPNGTYSTIQQSNTVISCASGFGSARPDDPEALAELIRTSAPRWGADVDADSFADRCADLVPEVELPQLTFEGDAPIVVIGGVNDPATPFRWSVEMADTLGPSAALVTWNGEGHGQLFGSSCLLDIASRVIVDLEPPTEGIECEPDPPVERPDFWDDIPVPDGIDPDPLPAEAMVLLGLPPRLVYGEARTSTLDADGVLEAYDTALVELGFQSFGVEEPLPGLRLATYASPSFEIVSVLVLTDEAYDDPELAPAVRLVDEGEVLLAIITFAP